MKKKMLSWSRRFSIFCFLDNQDYSIQPHGYECLLAAGCKTAAASLQELDKLSGSRPAWFFGHLSYELKELIHHLSSAKADPIGFSPFFFFEPEVVVQVNAHGLTVFAGQPEMLLEEILSQEEGTAAIKPLVSLQPRLTREAYLEKIRALQEHIVRGDCYEVNFCQEFFAEDAVIDPVEVFQNLAALSPNPFSALYRLQDKYLICASPERFLAKRGDKIFSQPMKGTIRRMPSDPVSDDLLKEELRQSAKDQSENVMVVDMVRNDLSRICREGTVKVDELFGVYSYPLVHQMISSISGELKPGLTFSEMIAATFPMGSMTGAPKHRVMELIEAYEESTRGIFSGSVGYIAPHGDFDLNVVIRSIMYNASSRYLSYQVGSGITFYSDPEQEWEECLLKGEAIKKVLTG